jgi:hypothetical protein
LIADLSLNIANGRTRGRAVIVSFLVGVMQSILNVAKEGRRQKWVRGVALGQPA